MNEQETDKILEESWANFEYAEINGELRNVITLTKLEEILNSLTPCINCGQTEGEVYEGPPHDHVCADCGRERIPAEDEPKRVESDSQDVPYWVKSGRHG